MANEQKTLLIVEGERTETVFFEQLQKAFGINLELVCFRDNIQVLYKKMKEMNFNADIKDILIEANDTEENRAILSQKFAYTYLIFDFDPHHTEEYEKGVPIDIIVKHNYDRVREMAEYFVDETDPSVGKLYINYPMMESYKDCDSFEEEGYLTRVVTLSDVSKYKSIVSHRKMANKRIDSYTEKDFSMLTKLNVRKLGSVCLKSTILDDYSTYVEESLQSNILQHEGESIRAKQQIDVLNTSAFFAIDYYGNQSGFFDSIMKMNS